jgi:hypothetical protein
MNNVKDYLKKEIRIRKMELESLQEALKALNNMKSRQSTNPTHKRRVSVRSWGIKARCLTLLTVAAENNKTPMEHNEIISIIKKEFPECGNSTPGSTLYALFTEGEIDRYPQKDGKIYYKIKEKE